MIKVGMGCANVSCQLNFVYLLVREVAGIGRV